VPAKTKPEKPRPSWSVDFVSCELDKATKEAVKKWDPKFESTIDGLDRMVADGYKISISLDKMHDCIGVYATMPDQSSKHHGLCLSSRGPSMLLALKVLVYKHFTILEQNWDAENNQRGEYDVWG
jgi:hypothetical protein